MKTKLLLILSLFTIAFAATGAPGDLPTTVDVTLAWNPNPEADIAGYRLYFSKSSGVYPDPPVDTGNVTTFTQTLPYGFTYFTVVTAYNHFGLESLPSNEVTFTMIAPGRPGGLLLTKATGNP